MKHRVYRNLSVGDTLFGLSLVDLGILACVVNIVFRYNRSNDWTVKLFNFAIIGVVYIGIILAKRYFAKGYLTNMIHFLFKRRRYLPTREEKLTPLKQVLHEKERI